MHRNLTRTLWSPLLAAALALSLAPAAAHAACQLNSPTGKIKHVVYVEFDNVHFTRDNPNVPGPGVQQLGATTAFFSDHVDVRPTLMFLVGLADDYTHDGRVLSEIINGQYPAERAPRQSEAGPSAGASLQIDQRSVWRAGDGLAEGFDRGTCEQFAG